VTGDITDCLRLARCSLMCKDVALHIVIGRIAKDFS
jgi:hypothetical protein